mmetsp:Transcript_11266/g.28472  ORF Transcript_11266/g.28472 Transcript_11266/m.28472 type:complete len:660 (+) Transcript_11266:1-1980(+)
MAPPSPIPSRMKGVEAKGMLEGLGSPAGIKWVMPTYFGLCARRECPRHVPPPCACDAMKDPHTVLSPKCLLHATHMMRADWADVDTSCEEIYCLPANKGYTVCAECLAKAHAVRAQPDYNRVAWAHTLAACSLGAPNTDFSPLDALLEATSRVVQSVLVDETMADGVTSIVMTIWACVTRSLSADNDRERAWKALFTRLRDLETGENYPHAAVMRDAVSRAVRRRAQLELREWEEDYTLASGGTLPLAQTPGSSPASGSTDIKIAKPTPLVLPQAEVSAAPPGDGPPGDSERDTAEIARLGETIASLNEALIAAATAAADDKAVTATAASMHVMRQLQAVRGGMEGERVDFRAQVAKAQAQVKAAKADAESGRAVQAQLRAKLRETAVAAAASQAAELAAERQLGKLNEAAARAESIEAAARVRRLLAPYKDTDIMASFSCPQLPFGLPASDIADIEIADTEQRTVRVDTEQQTVGEADPELVAKLANLRRALGTAVKEQGETERRLRNAHRAGLRALAAMHAKDITARALEVDALSSKLRQDAEQAAQIKGLGQTARLRSLLGTAVLWQGQQARRNQDILDAVHARSEALAAHDDPGSFAHALGNGADGDASDEQDEDAHADPTLPFGITRTAASGTATSRAPPLSQAAVKDDYDDGW